MVYRLCDEMRPDDSETTLLCANFCLSNLE